MDNKDDHEEHHPREWEVVSLTSSAYNVESRDARKYNAYYGEETSRDLFMSDHFVFPPSEHEDLPLDEEEQRKNGEDLMMEDQGLSRFEDEESIYNESALDSLGIDPEPNENPETDPKKATDNLPCEAWWRRRAVSLYSRTREANAIWSLFFAAAVTGLVVLGQRWQQEKWQVLQLKWQSSISSENLSRVLEPLSRLKDMIVRSSNSQASLVRSGSSSEI